MQKLFTIFSFIFLVTHLCYAGSLQDVYQSAQPRLGYDKLLILHPDSVYTGGLTITNEKIGIRGNGALINLQGYEITVSVCHCWRLMAVQ